MKRLIVSSAILLTVIATPHAQRGSASVQLPLRLSGAVISAGGVGNPTGTGRIEITVNRWSSPEERTHLTDALTNKGQDALLHELTDAKSVGTIRFNTELAWDLRYAREIPQDEGGTRVFLATDRPMTVSEIWNDPQYSRYPFTLIDLRLDPEREPTGSLMLAARVTADPDGRFINVENFATQPIAITNIRLEH